MSESKLKKEHNIEIPNKNYHTDKAYLKVYVHANLWENKNCEQTVQEDEYAGCKNIK